jgi:hypothetical protein
LVVNGESLSIDDIPEISVDKVKNLSNFISDSNTLEKEFREFSIKFKKLIDERYLIPPGSGIKVNYNEHGNITSVSELLSSDIPELSTNKIIGLENRLKALENIDHSSTIIEYKINPATNCKITYNSDGRVTSSSKLSIDDIPIEIMSKLNLIEERIPLLASQQSVSTILTLVNKKVDATSSGVMGGTFTKVRINTQGLVVDGSFLTLKDLPVINIKDIPELEAQLKRKADNSELIEIKNSISSLVTDLSQAVEVQKLKTQVALKADAEELRSLSSNLAGFKNNVYKILQTIPGEHLEKVVNDMSTVLTGLIGRVNTLEEKMNIKFDEE